MTTTMLFRQADLDELCALLRRNDSTVTHVDTWSTFRGYGRHLGEALLCNTTVSNITLRVDNVMRMHDDTIGDTTALLQYLQTSASLREVSLVSDRCSSPLLDSVFEAVARNLSVEGVALTLTSYNLFSNNLAHFIAAANGVTTLKFHDCYSQSESSTRREVGAALGANRTLRDLTIELRAHTTILPNDEPILRQLGSSRSLQSLCLYVCMENYHYTLPHYEAIASVLAETQTLERLHLIRYSFNNQALEAVLRPLRTNRTVSKLCLEFCWMDEDGTSNFVQFVQLHCNTPTTSSVQEISLNLNASSEPFEKSHAGTVAATMLIGSSLSCLNMCETAPIGDRPRRPPKTDMRLFFQVYLENVNQIRLASLNVGYMEAAAVDALVELLPQTVHLCHLVISRVEEGVRSLPLLAALRKNGSLHSVSIQQECSGERIDTTQPLFTPNELQRVDAYCMRNKMLPSLLRRSRVPTNDAVDKVPAAAAPTPVLPSMVSLANLLVVARPTVRAVPSSFLMGLQSAGDLLVGTTVHNGSKRRLQ